MPATKSVKKNIHNLAHGAHHADRVKSQGEKGAHRQEIAIAYAEARKAGKKDTPKKHVSKPGYPAKRKRK